MPCIRKEKEKEKEMEMEMEEKWVSIPDFPDYEISNLSRIRRITNSHRSPAGTILKFGEWDGYKTVMLSNNGKSKGCFVYRRE